MYSCKSYQRPSGQPSEREIEGKLWHQELKQTCEESHEGQQREDIGKMSIAIIQGYLQKRAMKSGKNWKKRYFVLDNEGTLSFSEKKGSPVKKAIKLTPTTQVNALKEMGELGGISITGRNHEPLYLRADSPEIADGWIRALNIMKSGGTSSTMKTMEQSKGATLREAYAKKNALGGSGRTLERKKKNQLKKTTLERKGLADQPEMDEGEELRGRPISFNPDLVPPPPMDDEDEYEPPVPRPLSPRGTGRTVESEDEESGTKFKDGYIMRIGNKDVFVDNLGWEYYASREEFLRGGKPFGRAVLSMMV